MMLHDVDRQAARQLIGQYTTNNSLHYGISGTYMSSPENCPKVRRQKTTNILSGIGQSRDDFSPIRGVTILILSVYPPLYYMKW